MVFAAISISLSSFVFSAGPRHPFHGFVIHMPDLVEVAPGGQILVDGGVTNIGVFGSHEVKVTASGLPEGYNVTSVPDYFQDLFTLREWSPETGVVRIPVNLSIIIAAPSDAVPGVYTVNVTLQEMQSWRQVANSTVFILRVSGEAPAPQIVVTNIKVPDRVDENVPFNISFEVENNQATNQSVDLTVVTPEGWTFEPAVASDVVPGNSSKQFYFSITPTNESGSFSIVVNYPFHGVVLNITKSGPFLTIGEEEGILPGFPSLPEIPGLSNISLPAFPTGAPVSGSAVEQALSFASTNPLLTVVIVVVIAILIYYFYTSYSMPGRRKPEEMSKQVELAGERKSELEHVKNKTVNTSDESTTISSA